MKFERNRGRSRRRRNQDEINFVAGPSRPISRSRRGWEVAVLSLSLRKGGNEATKMHARSRAVPQSLPAFVWVYFSIDLKRRPPSSFVRIFLLALSSIGFYRSISALFFWDTIRAAARTVHVEEIYGWASSAFSNSVSE